MTDDVLVSLERVGFRHAGARAATLSSVNLELRAGDRLLVAGASGSGKSTLVSIMAGLAPRFFPGKISGVVRLDYGRLACVLQNPEAQLVTPTVREEVAFPLENLGWPVDKIRSRVGEALETVGLAALADRQTRFLSGGEAQRLSLACAVAQDPDVLFLDEPTAFLDPANASAFFSRLPALSSARAWVVVEHRVADVRSLVNRAIEVSAGSSREAVLDRLCAVGDPVAHDSTDLDFLLVDEIAKRSSNSRRGNASGLPARDFFPSPLPVRFSGVKHSYSGGASILRGVEGAAEPGSVTVIMGASGSGKSTLLKKIAGLLPSDRGEIYIGRDDVSRIARRPRDLYARVLYVPQNPEHFFLSSTIGREWELSGADDDRIAAARKLFRLNLDPSSSPTLLSEGEKRRLTLALAFLDERPVILLDEPSYGLDREAVGTLAGCLLALKRRGKTVVVVTHAAELARLCSDRVYRLSEGQLSEERP